MQLPLMGRTWPLLAPWAKPPEPLSIEVRVNRNAGDEVDPSSSQDSQPAAVLDLALEEGGRQDLDQDEAEWVPAEKAAGSRGGLFFDVPASAQLVLSLVQRGSVGVARWALSWGTPCDACLELGFVELRVMDAIACAAASGKDLVVPLMDGNVLVGQACLAFALHQVNPRPSDLELWARRRRVYVLQGHAGPVTACAVFPCGRRLLTVGEDACGHACGIIWSCTGEKLAAFGLGSCATACAAVPLGNKAITVSEQDGCVVWSAEGERLADFSGVRHVAVFPAGDRVLLLSNGGGGVIWSSTGEQLAVLDRPAGSVSACAVCPASRLLVTATHDGWGAVWSAASGKRLAELHGHAAAATACAALCLPDGDERLLTAAEDGSAILWAPCGRQLAALSGHRSSITCCAMVPPTSNADARAVTLAADGLGILWSLAGRRLADLRGHTGRVTACAVVPGGGRFLSASQDGTAILWSVEGERLGVLRGHTGAINSCAIFPSGEWALTTSEDCTAFVWPLARLRQPSQERSGGRSSAPDDILQLY